MTLQPQELEKLKEALEKTPGLERLLDFLVRASDAQVVLYWQPYR